MVPAIHARRSRVQRHDAARAGEPVSSAARNAASAPAVSPLRGSSTPRAFIAFELRLAAALGGSSGTAPPNGPCVLHHPRHGTPRQGSAPSRGDRQPGSDPGSGVAVLVPRRLSVPTAPRRDQPPSAACPATTTAKSHHAGTTGHRDRTLAPRRTRRARFSQKLRPTPQLSSERPIGCSAMRHRANSPTVVTARTSSEIHSQTRASVRLNRLEPPS
jgi:hypothetical protein